MKPQNHPQNAFFGAILTLFSNFWRKAPNYFFGPARLLRAGLDFISADPPPPGGVRSPVGRLKILSIPPPRICRALELEGSPWLIVGILAQCLRLSFFACFEVLCCISLAPCAMCKCHSGKRKGANAPLARKCLSRVVSRNVCLNSFAHRCPVARHCNPQHRGAGPHCCPARIGRRPRPLHVGRESSHTICG